MKGYIIEQRIDCVDRYVVIAGSYEEAIAKIDAGLVTPQRIVGDPMDGEYVLVSEKNLAPPPPKLSFKQFQEARKFDPMYGKETGAIFPALIYPTGLYIEIGAGMDYVLTIGNQSYSKRFSDSNALESFESLLFNWAISEGIIEEVDV